MTIRGVFCAAATPVDERGNVDLARFANHARNLVADGCTGIALLGTTGEANSFSVAERRALLEAALEGGLRPSQLMPGTGLCAVPETVELTRHALSHGVSQVVMLPPFYYKGVSDDGIYGAYARVLDGVNDPRLRVILYHIPQMSAVPLSHALIARLLKAYPGIIAGIKDSAGDLANMQAMVKLFPGFTVLAGADPLMKPLLAAGGHGCITATSNIIARELAAVFNAAGDDAQTAAIEKTQQYISDVRGISNRFAQIPSVKAMIARRYGDPAWRNVRPPLLPLNGGQLAELDAAMASLEGPP